MIVITSRAFFNQEELELIYEKIFELETHWGYRQPMFYTLGTALYLDASVDFDSYQQKVKGTNPILKQHFSSLYERLKMCLEQEFKEPVFYEPDLGLPGFHIFKGPQNDEEAQLLKLNPTRLHFDLQFLQAQWNYKEIEQQKPMSFTLTIRLPQHGGGINYWDITYNNYLAQSPEEQTRAFESLPMQYYGYTEGFIVIHRGLMLHQIAVPEHFQKSDYRITLQGHALRCDGVWRVYW